MATIRVTGEVERNLDREPLELARRRRGSEVSRACDAPVCDAPFRQLVLDRDGKVHPCRWTRHALTRCGSRTLEEIWAGTELDQLRREFRDGSLRRDLCGICTNWLEALRPEQAPMLEAEPAPAECRKLREVRIRVDRGAESSKLLELSSLVREVPADTLLVLEGEEPLAQAAVQAWLKELGARPSRPAIGLAARSLPAASTVRSMLGPLVLARVEIRFGPGFEETLATAAELVGSTGRVLVRLELDAGNWYEIHRVVEVAAAHSARVSLSVEDDRGRYGLSGLALEEQRAVERWIAAAWHRYTDDRRPPALGPDDYSRLREALRHHLLEDARRTSSSDPLVTLRGRRRRLRFPPLEHPELVEESRAASLVAAVLVGDRCASLSTWIKRQSANPRFLEAGASRWWLRVLTKFAAAREPSRRLRRLLQSWYADPVLRTARLEEETRGLAHEGPALSSLEAADATLGVARMAPRSAPFAFAPIPAAAAAPAGVPLVTVLVPSFRHERYVVDCLKSVLAQSYTDFRLLVVDDVSPDATRERARSVVDPRLEVRQNATNRGLGNSVLDALETIDTPFVALLNSDDLFHPERLERCLAVLRDDETAQLVATRLDLIDAAGGRIDPSNVNWVEDGRMVSDWVHWYARATAVPPSPDALCRGLLRHNWLATSTNLVARTQFLRDQHEELRRLAYCLDWHLFLEAARTGGLRYLDQPLAAYRLHDSNTVWFQDRRRWRYALEVARVAVHHLRALAGDLPAGPEGDERRHALFLGFHEVLRDNAELGGPGSLLCDLLGGADLERLSNDRADAENAVRAIERRSARLLCLERAVAPWDDATVEEFRWRLAELPRLQVEAILDGVEREEAADLLGRVRALEHEVRQVEAERNERIGQLEAAQDRERRLKEQRREFSRDLGERLRHFEAGLSAPDPEREAGRVAADEGTTAGSEQAPLLQLERLSRSAELAHRDLEGLRQQVERLDRVERERDAEREGRLEAERRNAELLGSREWRSGNFFWNRIPGTARSARILKGGYRRSRNQLQRGTMLLQKLRRRLLGGPRTTRIVAASTGQFPVLSHTFVYQELLAYHDGMGADVTLLHQSNADRADLHAAFAYLDEHRVHVHSTWEQHTADFEHYRARMPEKVDSLIDALVQSGKLGREELLQNYEFRAAFTFTRRVEDLGADFVHTYFFYEQSLSGLVAKWLLGVPRAVSAYADHMVDDHPLKVVALHVRTADVIVATSRRIRDELLAIGGAQYSDKVLVKPNGVDGRRFSFVDRGPVQGALELLSVSRLEAKKGLIELVEALHLLRERPMRLHLVGAGDPGCQGSEAYADRLVRRIEELGLGDRVVLHGKLTQDRLRPLLERAHVFVAPYVETESGDKDGIPTAILEAIATGLPVVATDAGSIPEILDDGVEGLLVPQRDPAAFAAALARIADDDALRATLGRNARQRFEREFDTAVTEVRLHERVRQILGAGRSTR